MPNDIQVPRIFISYRWSSSEHQDWVLALATSLRSDGVEVILDKWHLKEGQDTLAFMESMITDDTIQKVLLICDRGYVERADSREGGVGTEAQIVSPQIYASTSQDKFAAIVVELNADGKPLLPCYMATRLYFDMSTITAETSNYESVVRWIFGKPFHVAPEIGKPPLFLDESYVVNRQLFQVEQRLNRVSSDNTIDGFSAAASMLEAVLPETKLLLLDLSNKPEQDELVFQRIHSTFPMKEQCYKAFQQIIRSGNSKSADVIHNFFEGVAGCWDMRPSNRSFTQWDNDPIHFFGHICFVGFVALAMREREFGLAADVLSMPLFKPNSYDLTGVAETYCFLRASLRSLDARNDRLGLRRISLHADLLNSAHEHSVLRFPNFVEADITLYIRGIIAPKYRWWPTSSMYVTDAYGGLPTFERAASARFYDRLKPLLLNQEASALRTTISADVAERSPRAYRDLQIARLINLEKLATSA